MGPASNKNATVSFDEAAKMKWDSGVKESRREEIREFTTARFEVPHDERVKVRACWTYVRVLLPSELIVHAGQRKRSYDISFPLRYSSLREDGCSNGLFRNSRSPCLCRDPVDRCKCECFLNGILFVAPVVVLARSLTPPTASPLFFRNGQ